MRKLKYTKTILSAALAVILLLSFLPAGFWGQSLILQAEADAPITLRVCNWEEYIDLGDWDEEETIELPSGDIIGENSMVKDFEEWYYETYGTPVKVEYSTFGTNEDLYNMLTLGDVYDLVCPSEYLIMKLMADDALVPLSEEFQDTTGEYNYYSRGVAPFIREIFDNSKINDEPWSRYAAGYMWGVTGLVYNPEIATEEQVSTWKVLADPSFARQVTIKDNVRDAYFAAVGAVKSDLLTSEAFRSDPAYKKKLEEEMNDTSPEMTAKVQEWLKGVKDNVYSFETDAGKADMITGKVAINYQWSGRFIRWTRQMRTTTHSVSRCRRRARTFILTAGSCSRAGSVQIRKDSMPRRLLSTSCPGRTMRSATCITSVIPPFSQAEMIRACLSTHSTTMRRKTMKRRPRNMIWPTFSRTMRRRAAGNM